MAKTRVSDTTGSEDMAVEGGGGGGEGGGGEGEEEGEEEEIEVKRPKQAESNSGTILIAYRSYHTEGAPNVLDCASTALTLLSEESPVIRDLQLSHRSALLELCGLLRA